MKRRRALAACLGMALWAPPTLALETVDEIQACVEANLPDETSVQTIAFRSRDRIGSVTESRAKIYWQKFGEGDSRVLMRFEAPPDLHGAGVLILEKKPQNDMFMYLPELGRVRRITGRMVSGSMFGTDFTYEQFQRLQGVEQDTVSVRLPDAQLDGRPVYVVEGRPKDDAESGFERVISFVDQERCIPLKLEFYERGDRLRKVLTADREQITKEAESWVPRRVVMKDLRDESETELVIEEIEVGKRIKRSVFTQRYLESGRD